MDALEREIQSFGQRIFSRLGSGSSSVVSKKYWTDTLMQWSMKRPELKARLFQLVDVLPALRSSASIAAHVEEYLGEAAAELPGPLRFGLRSANKPGVKMATAMAVKLGVRQMAEQFIAGETPQDALKELKRLRKERLAFTVDLLGEYCLSEPEADEYVERYIQATEVFGKNVPKWNSAAPIIEGHPGEQSPVCISVKLSALYSQTSSLNFERSVEVLTQKLSKIVRVARKNGALVYVDSEDVAHNGVILETFFQVFGSEEFKDFPYPGIVLQAYLRESEATLDRIINFSKQRGGPVAIRLVKGAYWDLETVISKQNGWEPPVWSEKYQSDLHYERLSRKMLDNIDYLLPAFGSHNIRSLAHACCYAKQNQISKKQFELQMLYGMAEPIAKVFQDEGYLVRMYVPLGGLIPGMGYLIRRLLENTSNESFLRHTFFDEEETEELLAHPSSKNGKR